MLTGGHDHAMEVVDSLKELEGVELGKVQAGVLLPVIASDGAPAADLDSSTDAQVRWYRGQRGRAV